MFWCECRVAWQTSGATPLFIASWNGHVECVRLLLGGGAAIDQATVGSTSSMARHRGGFVCEDVLKALCIRVQLVLFAGMRGGLRWGVIMMPMPCSRGFGHCSVV
jgi:hypothetical protein